jgi:hypothetical protein
MDTSSFDRIARLFGSALSRRTGLGLVAAALAGRAVLIDADAAPTPAGPCKSTRRPDNICTKNSDCCTRLCNTKLGKKNRDGLGRCRCVNRGGRCTDDRNCCSRRGQQMVCNSGVCGELTVCLGLQSICDPSTSICCDGACQEREYPAVNAAVNGDPVCCIPLEASGCTDDADCCRVDATCDNGTCIIFV